MLEVTSVVSVLFLLGTLIVLLYWEREKVSFLFRRKLSSSEAIPKPYLDELSKSLNREAEVLSMVMNEVQLSIRAINLVMKFKKSLKTQKDVVEGLKGTKDEIL